MCMASRVRSYASGEAVLEFDGVLLSADFDDNTSLSCRREMLSSSLGCVTLIYLVDLYPAHWKPRIAFQ